MDILNDIPVWLKSTIPGIIVLGACGSLLALAIIYLLKLFLRLLKYIFKKVLPRQAEKVVRSILMLIMKTVYFYGKRLGKYSVGNPVLGATFYFSYYLTCSICLLILSASMAIIVFIILHGTESVTILTVPTFTLTMGAFLLGFWSLRHFLFVFLPYHNYTQVAADTIMEELKKKEKTKRTSNIDDASTSAKQPEQPTVKT